MPPAQAPPQWRHGLTGGVAGGAGGVDGEGGGVLGGGSEGGEWGPQGQMRWVVLAPVAAQSMALPAELAEQ
tara:strand:+ start:129 stop:341 length:213 start_codon:yes stop_codon:yes gene_type:complete